MAVPGNGDGGSGVMWSELRHRRMIEPGAPEAYRNARLAHDLGRRIRELRDRRGLSQSRLARSVGLTQSEMARIEAGGSSPKLPDLVRMAAVLEADLVVRLEPRTGSAVSPG